MSQRVALRDSLPDPYTRRTILSGDIGTLLNNADNSYHVVTGSGVTETCLEAASGDTTSMDSSQPGGLYYYLVRGRNGCGNGTYGYAWPSGTESTSSACP